MASSGQRDWCWVTWPVLLVLGGVSLGAVLPKNEHLVGPWQLASNVIGEDMIPAVPVPVPVPVLASSFAEE